MSHADTDPGAGASSAKAARRSVAVVLCIAATLAPGSATAAAARQTLGRINCRVGKITRAYSKGGKGRADSQNPRFGAVLRGGGKVKLVVSRGRRPRR